MCTPNVWRSTYNSIGTGPATDTSVGTGPATDTSVGTGPATDTSVGTGPATDTSLGGVVEPASMGDALDPLAESLRAAPVVDRDGYEYFVHGVTDGVPVVEPDVLEAVVAGIREATDLADVDVIVAPEAMAIHHATALSLSTGIPFVVARKRQYGFPEEVAVRQETSYGESELHLNGVGAGDRVLLIDDVLSSGGTIRAVAAAIEAADAELVDVVTVLRRTDVDAGELPVAVTSLLEVRVEEGAVVVDRPAGV